MLTTTHRIHRPAVARRTATVRDVLDQVPNDQSPSPSCALGFVTGPPAEPATRPKCEP